VSVAPARLTRSRSGTRDRRTIATRDRLIEVADRLVQEKGFHRTTLAMVASKARVHLGSIYHFFRTKGALGEAIVEARLERSRSRLAEWDETPDPRERIRPFVRSVVAARGDLSRKGCPIGSLCQELHKERGPLAARSANLFRLLLDWLEAQFRLLGADRAQAERHAAHVMASLQGASLLALTFADPDLVAREAEVIERFVSSVGGAATGRSGKSRGRTGNDGGG
jgi:TetR/AcrR family transcriptional regulator, transcriptional repressor for nem operon